MSFISWIKNTFETKRSKAEREVKERKTREREKALEMIEQGIRAWNNWREENLRYKAKS